MASFPVLGPRGVPIRSPSLMHTDMWREAASAAYAGGDRNELVRVEMDGTEIASAALYSPSALSQRRKILGAIDIGESVDFSYRDSAALVAVVEKVLAPGRALDLGHFPVDSQTLEELRSRSQGSGLLLIRRLPERAMPYLSLNESWRDPDACISRNRRQSLRRKRRKAEQLGPVAVEIQNNSCADVQAALDVFIDTEARSWKGRTRTALAFDARQRNFYREFCQAAVRCGILRMCFLKIGQHVAAAQICAVFDDRFWSLKVGYDEKFSEYSPGELLTHELISHAAKMGLASFEFCGKEAPWTLGWTDKAHAIAAVRYYPYNVYGLIAFVEETFLFAGARLRTIWRKISQRGPGR